MALQHLDSNEFDEIIYDEAEPSIVIFSRESCSVCQEVVPILEDLQEKYDGRYRFYYINVEEEKNLLQRFSLKGVPQVLFFDEGEYKGKLAGNVEEDQLEDKIEELFE